MLASFLHHCYLWQLKSCSLFVFHGFGSLEILWMCIQTQFCRDPRWQRSRWMWSASLSMNASGIHLQTLKILQNTSWEQAGVPLHQKRIYRMMQNSVEQRKEAGKKRRVSRTGSVPEAGVRSPHRGNCLEQKWSIWGCWISSWPVTVQMEWESHSRVYLDRDTSSLESAAAGGWSIETGGSPGARSAVTAGWPEGGDPSGKRLWRKAGQTLRQGDTAESHTGLALSLQPLSPRTSARHSWKSPERMAL